MSATAMPRPKVGDPIIFRPERDGAEFVVRPCSGRCRNYWLSGYIVLSCKKCDWHKLAEEQP